MMERKDMASEVFGRGLTCSQAVAVAFAEHYGIDPDTILKLSRGFGGGMGGMGGQCGAVSGAYMVIGMGYDPTDPVAKGKVYEKVQEFTRKFRERHSELNCNVLLGCDISSAEGKAMMKEKNLRETHCACFVKDSVDIAEEVLGLRS
ncbi:MAG: GCAxxG family protein [Anaerosporomusa subterranea]|jgi:C_GCAxxG_C_C family probable redox protein|nr:GCAxxG family protein [Anaerosporomusa subterranea]